MTSAVPVPQTVSSLCFQPENDPQHNGLPAFASTRRRLFSIAYRMLGSSAEAEDMVQEVWLRWQSAERSRIENPAAYLATTTTRLCLNLIQSAHTRHETCAETWLPEAAAPDSDPGLGAERGEAVRLAVVILLEKLTPTERAAYVLREAFDYSYDRIASILQREEPNIRQLVSRARKHLVDGRCSSVDSDEQTRFFHVFTAAAQTGEMNELERLFAGDLSSDSESDAMHRREQPILAA